MFDILALQRFYPELYFRLMPFASVIVSRFGGQRTLTERDVNRMVQELLIVSSVLRNPPRGFSNSSIIDLARILILINLHNQGYTINPFWALYFGNSSRFLLQPFFPPARPPIRPIPPFPPVRPTPPIHPVPPIGQLPPPRPPVMPPNRPGAGRPNTGRPNRRNWR